jgi:hypothetical protein
MINDKSSKFLATEAGFAIRFLVSLIAQPEPAVVRRFF